MTNILVGLIILFAFMLGLVGVYLVYRLVKQLRSTDDRLRELEKAGQKRHTHATIAGLEDALAVSLDIIRENESSKKYTDARLSQLNGILQELRSGPNNYDQNKPAGRRPAKKNES